MADLRPRVTRTSAQSGIATETPQAAPVGEGAVRQAINTISLRKKYSAYSQDLQESGESPKSFSDWASENGYEIRAGADLPVKAK